MMRRNPHKQLANHADAEALSRFARAAESSQEEKSSQRKGGDEGESGKSEDGPQKLAKKGEELKEDMDALVDEIDDVLEENAEEFVKNYVQRGGQ